MLKATAKTHKVTVFKNQHTTLGESIILSEFWVPMDANHFELQRMNWDAKTVQEQKATSPAHLIRIWASLKNSEILLLLKLFVFYFIYLVAWGQATV